MSNRHRKHKMLRAQVAEVVAAHQAANDVLLSAEEALGKAQDEKDVADNAKAIIVTIAETVQQAAHDHLAGIVSRCLTAVFGVPYTFEVEWVATRGKTEARLWFVRDGVRYDPLTATGGGVVDVAAFALRVAALVAARPPVRRLLVLDEPFRFVSAGHRPAVRQLLLTLADELGIQFVLVTHIPELTCGKVVELS